jgi:hypothetical protein
VLAPQLVLLLLQRLEHLLQLARLAAQHRHGHRSAPGAG